MNRHIFYFSLLSLSVAACSGTTTKQAAGDFDYTKKSPPQEISVPQELNKPKRYDLYHITEKINHDGPVGLDMDIRSPSLVLPIATSSRVVANSDKALIWFDKFLEDKDLTLLIEESITKQLSDDNVSLRSLDSKDKTFESDWYENKVESGYWPFKTLETVDSMRFRYQLAAKPHGRSVSLTVSLIEYRKTGSSNQMDPIDKQRAEMAMINNIISQVDYTYRLQRQENSLTRANSKMISVTQNDANEPSYLVAMVQDPLWINLPDFFAKYGFTLDDRDEKKQIYFVDFVKPETSIWAGIWGDKKPVLDLADGKYQFALAARGDNTLLTIYDANNQALSTVVLNDIIEVMDEGLSFRN